jgi:hypothetical protein
MAYYETVATVVNRAARQLGLISATIADPFLSTDPNIGQMLSLLTQAGQDLVREHEWPQLREEHTFTTSDGVFSYDLPSQFHRHVTQTQWNRTGTRRLGGPVTPQGWQALKGEGIDASITYWFRTEGQALRLHPTPTSTETLALEYVRSTWVLPDGGSASDRLDAPAEYDDTILFDGPMMVHRLKRDWRLAKGLDATAASLAYEAAMATALSSAASAGPISVTSHPGSPRLLGTSNIPDTGFGS